MTTTTWGEANAPGARPGDPRINATGRSTPMSQLTGRGLTAEAAVPSNARRFMPVRPCRSPPIMGRSCGQAPQLADDGLGHPLRILDDQRVPQAFQLDQHRPTSDL